MGDQAGMKRCNFTLDGETVALLERMAEEKFGGNRSEAIRVAIHALAEGQSLGWVVTGFTPIGLETSHHCHCCEREFGAGDTLYRPVFERKVSAKSLRELPSADWLDCALCAGGHL